jgi:hypothetical protein
MPDKKIRYATKRRLRLGVAPPQDAREKRKHGDHSDRNQNRIEGHCGILPTTKNAKTGRARSLLSLIWINAGDMPAAR